MPRRLVWTGLVLPWTTLVLISSGDRGEDDDEKTTAVSQGSDQQRSIGLMSKGSMVSVVQTNRTGVFPEDFEGLTIKAMAASEIMSFKACPFNTCLTWKHADTGIDEDVTGTTWSPVTLPPSPDLGILASASAFAWINPGHHSAPGGWVYQNEAGQIVGANTVCDPTDPEKTHIMRFCPPEDIQQLPSTFAIGRLVKITLPFLLEAGAMRFTWVHKDEDIGFKLTKGGFLYLIEKEGQAPRLVFFQMLSSDKDGCTTMAKNSSSSTTVQHTKGVEVSVSVHVS